MDTSKPIDSDLISRDQAIAIIKIRQTAIANLLDCISIIAEEAQHGLLSSARIAEIIEFRDESINWLTKLEDQALASDVAVTIQ